MDALAIPAFVLRAQTAHLVHDSALFSQCHMKELEGLTLQVGIWVSFSSEFSWNLCFYSHYLIDLGKTGGKEHFIHPGKQKHGIKEKLG